MKYFTLGDSSMSKLKWGNARLAKTAGNSGETCSALGEKFLWTLFSISIQVTGILTGESSKDLEEYIGMKEEKLS